VESESFHLLKIEKQKAVFKHVGSDDELTLEINAYGRLQGSWLRKSASGNNLKIGYRLKKQF
jgi:hypothetical protein